MITVHKIAETIDGRLIGDPDSVINGVCDLKQGKKGYISFIRAPKYHQYFMNSNASAVIVNESFAMEAGNKIIIHVKNPVLAFAKVLEMFDTRPAITPSIHKTATISTKAKIGSQCFIGPNVVIEDEVILGNGSNICAGSYIGANSVIGKKVTIHPNVTVYHNCKIGDNVTIDSGTVIGGDGFGWITENKNHYKIPQIGKVIINENVWIGSNCNIDRGTFMDTIIGNNCKFDSHIHIAHNVVIGDGCLFAAQVGIAGTTKIGNYVTLAGQVGVVDHITIGDNSIVASKSAVMQSIDSGSFYSGIPARPHNERKRQDVVIRNLPDIAKRLRLFERKFEDWLKKRD